jgi:hypothetical protein
MDFTVLLTVSIILIIIGIVFALFYHAFSIGKEEETE